MDQFCLGFPWWYEKIIVILQKIIIFCNNIKIIQWIIPFYLPIA